MYRAYPKKPTGKVRPDPKKLLIQRVAKARQFVEENLGCTDSQIKLACGFGPNTWYNVYKTLLETTTGYTRTKGIWYFIKPIQVEELK